jgi:transcription elongation factor GreB
LQAVSRAFVKEDNSEPPLVRPRAPLPDGTPNYVTRRGLAALHDERSRLQASRPNLDVEADSAALAELNARLGALDARIASAVPVDAASVAHDEVRFSAAVTLRDAAGRHRRYRIVGVDEADAESGRIAFTAPLARAISGKRLGDAISLRQPGGESEFEIIEIDYTQE